MASSSSTTSQSYKYDVYLSFREEDTNKAFIDHLYSTLDQNRIRVYREDKTLPCGKSMDQSLEAIEQSEIIVIIFSNSYADSSLCLKELVYIMKHKKERRLTVLPLFYDVDPSNVMKQKGNFGKAFAKQVTEDISVAESWRNALFELSNLSGWVLENNYNGRDSDLINVVVKAILDRSVEESSFDDEDMVGMRTRLQDLELLLDNGSGGVRMVGIWGGGGSGKTTLATSCYIEISKHFQGDFFLENVREETNKHGLKSLQEKMLSRLLKRKEKVHSVIEGKQMMRSMLSGRKVLVILDDVDKLDQLEALAGNVDWFGSGSRIIITTRDESLLRDHNVGLVYPVILLSHDEAIQLFKYRAFSKKDPAGYETLSSTIVSYAAGLPLAIKVLGSFLNDRPIDEWESTLNRIQYHPDEDITQMLQISYDGLTRMEQELFLDVACFFRGRSKDDVIDILEAFGYYPKKGIEVLRNKTLITIVDGLFDMHNLLQEMAGYIVRGDETQPNDYNRVWKKDDIENMDYWMFTMREENHKTEAISYKGDAPHFCMIVSNMKKLRYMNWEGCPATPLPDTFQPSRLVALKLEDSLQKKIWKGLKCLPHLKVLQLKYMKELLTTPDFEGLSFLEKLTLSYCDKLKDIHQSLGKHTSLEKINVSRCPKLRMFPTIVHMEKLKTLELEHCLEISEFPEIRANMESLEKLSLKWIGLEVLPSSIGDRCPNLICLHLSYLNDLKSIEFSVDALRQLKDFKLEGLNNLEMTRCQLLEIVFHQFPRGLRELNLSACCLEDGEIPSDIANLSNLQELDLSWNYFSQIDFSLSRLTQLKRFKISGCDRLLELPELPSSLAMLNADSCNSLTRFGDCYKKCEWLCQVSLMGGSIIDDGKRLLQFMLEGKAIEHGSMLLQLIDAEIPNWFTPPLRTRSICRLQLPANWCNDFCGFLMCAVFTNDFDCQGDCILVSMSQVTSSINFHNDVVWKENDSDVRTWVGYVSFSALRHSKWWDERYSKVSFKLQDKNGECSGFGVRLVAKKSTSGPTETSTNPSNYTPNFKIQHDLESALTISIAAYDGHQQVVT